ncbi:MAG: prolyl oligopeptidase family serine peptidase [Pirellulales bacterium]|nr:prolyl oligopeptidase family serine peptidase [Pirellulales bacterium]
MLLCVLLCALAAEASEPRAVAESEQQMRSAQDSIGQIKRIDKTEAPLALRTYERWLGPQTWVRDTKGPIIELGEAGQFDDAHVLTPLVAFEKGQYRLWYSGSRDAVAERVFRLGVATSDDGRRFEKFPANPIFEFGDGKRSILTPTLLRDAAGNVLRENGKLRMWFSAADFRSSGEHTLHESTSGDGFRWTPPSKPQLRAAYAPTVIKEDGIYRLWYVDISSPSWTIRHATSRNGRDWNVSPQVCLKVDQSWESGNLFYPTALKVDGLYLLWYGSYWRGHSQKTALGCAVSGDGLNWMKNPHNPVFRPEPERPWESHYTTSQSVLRLPDGSWRIWYSSRKAPPHANKYFALCTARWAGPEHEPDDATLADKMPDPSRDRVAFERWQRELRARLTEMLGIPKDRPPLAAESRGNVDHDGLTIEKWVFTSEPGSRVPALLYRKQDRKGRMPAIVLTYGHGGSKSQPDYQYIAQTYAKMGIAVLAIDPLGEEERHEKWQLGTRAHDSLEAHETAWKAGRPIMGKLAWDAMRGVDFLLARGDIDPARLGVAGNSLGGALAGWMAVLEPRLCCAVVSGWAFDDEVLRYGKNCTRVPNEHMRKMCTWPQYLALAAPHCSMLVMNGDADVIIDSSGGGDVWRGTRRNVEQAEKTYAQLGNPGGIAAWFEPGGGHRPYPAHKAGLKWLVGRLHPAGWTKENVERLADANFGQWASLHNLKLERLYGTPLHLQGATVAEMNIRPLAPKDLACLRKEELGDPAYTLDGWLKRIGRKQSAGEGTPFDNKIDTRMVK